MHTLMDDINDFYLRIISQSEHATLRQTSFMTINFIISILYKFKPLCNNIPGF